MRKILFIPILLLVLIGAFLLVRSKNTTPKVGIDSDITQQPSSQVFSIQPTTTPSSIRATLTLRTPQKSIEVLVASTSEARSQGLSNRVSLSEDTGMLFIFPEPGHYGFWMKDMHFDLDMIWIDAAKKVVGVAKGTAAASYPYVFMPPRDIQYVLEVNAGYADIMGIATGTALSF